MADDATLDPIVERALKLWKLSADAFADQRKRELDDLRFQVPELQWSDDVRAERTGQAVNGIPVPPRPMLSISQVDQPIQLVQNQQRAAHLGVQIHPLDEKADNDTAEALQDLYRAIERDSNADQQRTWAFDRSLKCGMGWYRILPVWADEGNPWDQKIQIRRILNQASVYPDPFAVEADFSDMRFLFETVDLPWDRYKREFPDSAVADYDATDFEGLGDEQLAWMGGGQDEEGRSVRVAEYFQVEYDTVTLSLMPDGRTVDGKVEGAKQTRKEERAKVMWRKINCVEVLEETELPGPWIPYILTIGRELQVFDQQRRWSGLYTNAKDGQRLLNYSVSSLVEKQATGTKAPWIIAEGQEEGHEAEFALANVRNLPYLRYKPTSLNGQPLPPPQRNMQTADLSSEIMLIQQAKDFIQSTTAVYDPSLGKSAHGESGKKVLALQAQAEAGNSGYLENLAGISMRHEARIILKWIPVYYDRPGRVVRTVKPDQTEVPIMINQPFVVDPKTNRPVAAKPQDKSQTINLKEGVYGVAVTIGKSYNTSRMEGSDALGQILQADPALMPILGPTWMQFQDWPGHDEAAELLKKMQPPQLRDEGEPDPQQLMQENQQLKAAGQEVTAQLKQAMQAIETKQVEQQGKLAETQANNAAKIEVERIQSETKLKLEQLKFQHEMALKGVDLKAEKLLLDDQQRHEMALSAAEAHVSEKQAERAEAQAERAADREDARAASESMSEATE